MKERSTTLDSVHSPLALKMLRVALREADFLKDVPSKLLTKLAKSIPVRYFEPGDTLMQQGEYGHTVFVLLDGVIELTVDTEAGETITLGQLSDAGLYVGEQSLLGRSRREATAKSLTRVLVAELEKTVVERLDIVCDGHLFPVLQRHSEARSISYFLGSHRFLGEVSPEWCDRLVEDARIQIFPRGESLFTAQESSECVWLLKAGVAKLQRTHQNETSVLSYFNVGDLAGINDGIQTASLVSMGHVEAIGILRDTFRSFAEAYPDVVERFKKDQPTVASNSATIAGFVDDFLSEGAQEGLSLLTINLDKCVRCGNCVQACESRHGHARFTRRGKTLVRRKKMEQAGRYETLLIPSSCRHCVNPECMVGCPTGAIHRKPGGEVDIEPFCIGCGSCATRCPYDNITMIPTPGRLVDSIERNLLANKCNLCAGYDGPNCVNNCPTGAILRIEPTAYFEELVDVIGKTGQVAVGQTRQRRLKDMGRWLIPVIALLVAVALGVWSFTGDEVYSPWSVKGMTLGGLATGFMFGAIALAARRRMRGLNTQLGRFLTWTRIHIYLGLLSLVAVVFHSRGEGGGPVTTVLWSMTIFEIATGLFGLAFYKWLPKVITRIEGDAQVEEDVRTELANVETAMGELAATLGSHGARTIDIIKGTVPRRRTLYSKAYQHDEAEKTIEGLTQPLAAASPQFGQTLGELARLALRAGELRACLTLYGIRRAWLLCHIGVSALLLTLVVVHIGAVFYFWQGLGS